MITQLPKKQYKLALLGEGAVGKSAITCRYVFKKFLRDYNCTIEDVYNHKAKIDGDIVELDILDTAGMEDFRMVRDANIKFRDGFILVFDVTNRESFERLQNFRDLIRNYNSDSAPILIVGNKIDMEKERVVSSEEAREKCKELRADIEYMEMSAQTGYNVEECFATIVRMLKHKESIANSKKSKVTEPAGSDSCCKSMCTIF